MSPASQSDATAPAVEEADPAERTVKMSGVGGKVTVNDGIRQAEYAPRSGSVKVEPGHVGAVLAHFPDATVVEDGS
jgi:D-serine deaminase-like pyridoxal phosphate-dependent protein